MKKALIIFFLVLVLSVLAFVGYKTFLGNKTTDSLLQNSEGTCQKESDCIWAGEGCGGGHGFCTNNPGKYEGAITTCDIVPDFPTNKGFKCGCDTKLGKCAWKK